ncbi:MAG: hypothetical protein E5W86_30810, partial [Mesorhizobium sp.]
MRQGSAIGSFRILPSGLPSARIHRFAALRLLLPPAGQTVYTGQTNGHCVSNYPLSYKLSWLPRFLRPSLGG